MCSDKKRADYIRAADMTQERIAFSGRLTTRSPTEHNHRIVVTASFNAHGYASNKVIALIHVEGVQPRLERSERCRYRVITYAAAG